MRAAALVLTERYANFPQAPEGAASLISSYVGGTLSLLPQVEWTPRCLDSKEGRMSLQCLECRFIFYLTDERISESPVETLENALDPLLIWTGDLISL